MMKLESDNWIVQNLQNALDTWNEKLAEIWQIITQSPEILKVVAYGTLSYRSMVH
jgi:hypothetical protein